MQLQKQTFPEGRPIRATQFPEECNKVEWGCNCQEAHALIPPLTDGYGNAKFCSTAHEDHLHMAVHIVTREADGSVLFRGWVTTTGEDNPNADVHSTQ